MPSILQRGGRPSQGSKSRRAHLGVATTSRSGMTTCGCGRCGTPPDVIADFIFGDYFARPSKHSGAWVTRLRDREKLKGDIRPLVVNVMNFYRRSFSRGHDLGHARHRGHDALCLLTGYLYGSLLFTPRWRFRPAHRPTARRPIGSSAATPASPTRKVMACRTVIRSAT
jgi:hypothetical protein